MASVRIHTRGADSPAGIDRLFRSWSYPQADRWWPSAQGARARPDEGGRVQSQRRPAGGRRRTQPLSRDPGRPGRRAHHQPDRGTAEPAAVLPGRQRRRAEDHGRGGQGGGSQVDRFRERDRGPHGPPLQVPHVALDGRAGARQDWGRRHHPAFLAHPGRRGGRPERFRALCEIRAGRRHPRRRPDQVPTDPA